MEQSATEQKVRRIVTGHDAQGRSVIVSDTTAVMERPLHELWVTNGTPARFGGAPHLGALSVDLEPPNGGIVVRFVRFMPSQGLSQDDVEQMYSMGFAAINATHTRVDTRRHPAMHKTRTLDCGIVLSGRIKLIMDEGEQELKPFDVVIQRGTNHGWVNPGSEPALMAFMLIDARE
jgi:mannose-6-phosphate isomerase-like protein (cupin superfamily)